MATWRTQPNDETDPPDATRDTAWRQLARDSGIVGASDMAAWGLTTSTSTPTATLACAGLAVLVDGSLVSEIGSANQVLDPTAAGTQPTGSEKRTDLVVARYDTTIAAIVARGSVELVPGTPSVSPSPPAPTQNAGGVWELPLWELTRAASGLITSVRDRRSWVADGPVALADDAPLTGPIGAVRSRAGVLWQRQPGSPSPVWRRLGARVGELPRASGFDLTVVAASEARPLGAALALPGSTAPGVLALTLTAEMETAGAEFAGWLDLTVDGVSTLARRRLRFTNAVGPAPYATLFEVDVPGGASSVTVIARADPGAPTIRWRQVQLAPSVRTVEWIGG